MSAPDPTPPVGEGGTLEERLRQRADSRCEGADEFGPYDICGWCGQHWPDHDGDCVAADSEDALTELTRLRAEVASLTDDLRRECEASEHHRTARAAAEAEVARLTAELAEADRRAGAAERQRSDDSKARTASEHWLRHAKEEAGHSEYDSFDLVWTETLQEARRAKRYREALAEAWWLVTNAAPHAWDNGNTGPGGYPDEGGVLASQIMERVAPLADPLLALTSEGADR